MKRSWLELLDPALEMFAALERTRGPVGFTLGGGTMLMRRYRHRKSHDLDIGQRSVLMESLERADQMHFAS